MRHLRPAAFLSRSSLSVHGVPSMLVLPQLLASCEAALNDLHVLCPHTAYEGACTTHTCTCTRCYFQVSLALALVTTLPSISFCDSGGVSGRGRPPAGLEGLRGGGRAAAHRPRGPGGRPPPHPQQPHAPVSRERHRPNHKGLLSYNIHDSRRAPAAWFAGRLCGSCSRRSRSSSRASARRYGPRGTTSSRSRCAGRAGGRVSAAAPGGNGRPRPAAAASVGRSCPACRARTPAGTHLEPPDGLRTA